ncbi:MAG: peptidoglycan DD-metalloendopeptidase family protein [Clostridiales bacterium]|jgi:murein DD-endopeptidase MepM/ murein hydrolase activator NlpD|nr:peptidoglycan DD-metalloendopeptidase family protein [Clostridiales bacterium]
MEGKLKIVMDDLKFKKHKQSKFFTVMLVPYSSKKTASIRIPHWVMHFAGIVFCAIAAVILFSVLRAKHFKLEASSTGQKLEQAWQANLSLSKENNKIETNAREREEELIINSQETLEETILRERETYLNELKAYEEKTQELEQKIQEIDSVKNEIYTMLGEKSPEDLTFEIEQQSFDVKQQSFEINRQSFEVDRQVIAPGSGKITFLAAQDTGGYNLMDTYTRLEQKLNADIADFALLHTETGKVKKYLDAKPNVWPVWGIVTSEVGSRNNPFGGPGTEPHSGIDIAVDTGTSVKAPGAGEVIYADWSAGYGNLVTIDHGYGIVTKYGHNSKILVSAGDFVKRGDIIAKSGSTGRSTGPHLHYEILVDGYVKNPRNFIE